MRLTPDKKKFHYNMIKGRVGETLIQELFLSSGYQVFHYGMERSIPGITGLLKGVDSDAATEMRNMPDFVVQNPNDQQVYFMEVKYRSNEEFSIEDLPKNYPWINTYFVIVSRKHIKCVTYKELKDGKSVSPKCRNYLSRRKEFGLDKDVIVEFCQFAIKFFEGV